MERYCKKPSMADVIGAARFTTNNEANGSPTMDKIVNEINQGRNSVGAWHNGTDIYVMTPDGEKRAYVGDWIVKTSNTELHVYDQKTFEDRFMEYPHKK